MPDEFSAYPPVEPTREAVAEQMRADFEAEIAAFLRGDEDVGLGYWLQLGTRHESGLTFPLDCHYETAELLAPAMRAGFTPSTDYLLRLTRREYFGLSFDDAFMPAEFFK